MTALSEYLASKIDKSGGPKAHWPWTGSMYRGQPYLAHQGRWAMALRDIWKLFNRKAPPPGKSVFRKCGIATCCNPSHLVLVKGGKRTGGTPIRYPKEVMDKAVARVRAGERSRDVAASIGCHHGYLRHVVAGTRRKGK